MAKQKVTDRRIKRTRRMLHEALMSLVREKGYDQIVVKEILDRANVGRSTFYMHFRDKDDLLISSIEELLGPVAPGPVEAGATGSERLLSFSLPLLAHIERHRRVSAEKMGARGRALLHGHLREVLAGRIAGSLRKESAVRRKGAIPPDLLARHIASTFVLVLDWWVEEARSLSPGEVDGLFFSLMMPMLERVFEP